MTWIGFNARYGLSRFTIASLIIMAGPVSAQQYDDWYYSHSHIAWFRYLGSVIGGTGSQTLQVVEREGLILSRLAGNRAAYSFESQRIPANQRNPNFTTSTFDFVAEYEACNVDQDFLEGTVFKLDLKFKVREVDDLISSIIALQAYFDGHRTPDGVYYNIATHQVSETEWLQTRVLGASDRDVIVRFRLSNNTQQIQLQLVNEKLCEPE